jgi:protein gp37
MTKTKIEWADYTCNLWWGCTPVTTGCKHCYARTWAKRNGYIIWGNNVARRKINDAFDELAKCQKRASNLKTVYKVFIGSMMDIFEDPMPLMDNDKKTISGNTGELRDKLFDNISKGMYPNLMFMLLTKRPENINSMIPTAWLTNPPVNVMYGSSPVNKLTCLTMIEPLLLVNAKRFLSVEPLLEEISLMPWLIGKQIDQVIVGGESGGHRRVFDANWARKIKLECEISNTAFFMKQIDKVIPIPDDLKIRQFPKKVFGCAAAACGATSIGKFEDKKPSTRKSTSNSKKGKAAN